MSDPDFEYKLSGWVLNFLGGALIGMILLFPVVLLVP